MAEPAPAAAEAEQSPAATRRRGRPRSEKSKAAILAVAGELLLERGLDAVSMDAIAERAGVSKATIYRWWPTKETLAIDALYEDWAAAYPVAPDTGCLRDDLRGVFLPWVDHIVKRPYARVLGALITRARTDEAFAKEFDQRLVQPRRDRARIDLRSSDRARGAPSRNRRRACSRPPLRAGLPPLPAGPSAAQPRLRGSGDRRGAVRAPASRVSGSGPAVRSWPRA